MAVTSDSTGLDLDRSVLVAFAGVVVFGGTNAVAIYYSNQELAPIWGAALRFGFAALLLVTYLAFRRIRFPSGSGLGGAIAFGVLGATANGLAYWAILQVPAAIATVFLAAVPLVTMFLAALHGLESVRLRGVVGGVLAVSGILALSNPNIGADIPLLALLALVGAVVCVSEAGIIVKKYPSHSPAATNGSAMLASTVVLVAASAVFGETWSIPSEGATWLALAHLVLLGTVGLFGLFLYVLRRWTASATAYATVLMPVVTALLGFVLLGQSFTWGMALAAGLILAGVYLGALSLPKVPVPAPPEEEALSQRCASC